MPAYCSVADIADYLGRVLTSAEQAQADVCALAATAHVDRYTGRTWQAGTVSNERHTLLSGAVYLTRPPVTAVTSVTSRPSALGSATTALVAGSGYELLDGPTGLLLVTAEFGSIITVTYTSTPVVPDDINVAATILSAELLVGGPATAPGGLAALTVDDLSLRYDVAKAVVSPRVVELLAPYVKRLVFA